MEWSIQQVAQLTGTTSRTLRHYDDIGLLPPARIGSNGYRHYDEAALVRLQRILLLRELGLGLGQIAEIVDRETDEQAALEHHLAWLGQERTRLERRIAAVKTTIDALRGGERLMAEKMFDGFDHTQYKDEVEQRWGKDAYADSDRWWRGQSASDKDAFMQRSAQLQRDWIAVAESGAAPDSDEALAVAEHHVAWLTGIPGTPAASGDPDMLKAYVTGLGDMYVADPRFAANYATSAGGTHGAEFVRDALAVYAAERL
ncbi:MerR family transcriptional regulator [Microbacterium thalassium]|uniref:DNA-binding transcriptional MerR regulator n=1 Tax=Microbacterium thalassium TaxID=362649 RepID=A0A7X0KTG3_9MICO|nr:MerR family transcriptional regulator [Microbacterium thalassium]MBB6390091.1 DNA-binding transcriptional MerR regulator [Microbacterium thalassium]GLK25199.1 MerR family transcriptional regulator [Microbacterium thalassium]